MRRRRDRTAQYVRGPFLPIAAFYPPCGFAAVPPFAKGGARYRKVITMKQQLLPEASRKNATPAQNAAYVATLKKMIDCKTVWTEAGDNKAEYDKFYRVVAESFPLLHARAKRLTFGDGCFFYVIEGTNAAKNILLMSHHDVVDGGEGWATDPFCAVEQDGYLYGRGTIDTKTPLFAQLQAAEELLAEGYTFPGMNLYIGSSHNEEVGGDGMVLAVEHFKQAGIRFDVILDEGGAITTGQIPGVTAKSAVVAVHEKSRHLYRCTVTEQTVGHGGLKPTTGSPLGDLSAFIAKVEQSKICKPAFAPEVEATFTRHAPYMSFPLNVVFGNFRLFSPLIKKIMAGIPQAAAMLTTGVTFTTGHAGDPALPHIKAKQAEAYLYLRCVREEQLERELEQIKAIARAYNVEIELVERDYCQPTGFDTDTFRTLEALLHENFPDVIVAPFLLTAGTDARRFTDIADNILRFAPIDLSKEQFATIHGDNEHIGIDSIGQCVIFYKDYIQRTAV